MGDTWNRLPSYHVARRRLTDPCSAVQTVVLEAGGGYGKSVLAAELVERWGALPVWVLLEEGGVSARLLVGRLRDAVARAGLTDAACAMAARGDDPSGAIDAMLTALDAESCAIVVDDAHHADREAARLIVGLAAQRGESVRVHLRLERHNRREQRQRRDRRSRRGRDRQLCARRCTGRGFRAWRRRWRRRRVHRRRRGFDRLRVHQRSAAGRALL
ncbi:MAG: hypothetical protein ACLP01_06120 [Solirubrobacteraceae bacterium]